MPYGLRAFDQECGDCELVIVLKSSASTSAPVVLAIIANVVATHEGPICLVCPIAISGKKGPCGSSAFGGSHSGAFALGFQAMFKSTPL